MLEQEKSSFILAHTNEAMIEEITMLENKLSRREKTNIVLVAYQSTHVNE